MTRPSEPPSRRFTQYAAGWLDADDEEGRRSSADRPSGAVPLTAFLIEESPGVWDASVQVAAAGREVGSYEGPWGDVMDWLRTQAVARCLVYDPDADDLVPLEDHRSGRQGPT